MRWHTQSHRYLLAALLVGLLCVPAGATLHEYVEDFTTKSYCDTLSTTADWNTALGEIRLPSFEIEYAGFYDHPAGPHVHVAVEGDYAYVVNSNGGLVVLDVTDPTTPDLAGYYDTASNAIGVALAGNYAYVADGSSGLQVVDISDPTNPFGAGSVVTVGAGMDVAVAGDHVYVADGAGGLQVVDVSAPPSPSLVGAGVLSSDARDVAVAGDYVYVADRLDGLLVYDVSDPALPSLVGSYDTAQSMYGVAVVGDYAYVAYAGSGLLVLDVSDPTDPAPAGSYSAAGSAREVVVSGNFAYMASFDGGLQVIDVTDPTNPVGVQSYATAGSAQGLAVEGAYAYVACDGAGLFVLSIADATDPGLVGGYDTSHFSYGVCLFGDHAFVADGGGGVDVIDISDPATPFFVGSGDIVEVAYGVAVAGDYMYVADGTAGLTVLEMADPTSPGIVAFADTPGSARDVVLAGDFAYVADFGGGLQIIDISDPTDPVPTAEIDTVGDAEGLAIAGNYVYVAARNANLQVIDITDPTDPLPAGSLAEVHIATAVAVSGDYAYVAELSTRVRVVDITDPTTPVSVATCMLPESAKDVAVSGDRLFVANYLGDLAVVDITDPTDPVLMGSASTPGRCYGVALDGDHAFMADFEGGLQIIEVFQRAWDLDANAGQSLDIAAADDAVVRARLATAQTDSVTWELSADGGTTWEGALPGAAWQRLGPGAGDLRWRSDHTYAGGEVNPACTDLTIEWLDSYPAIDAVSDLPADQGGRVRLAFARSGLDFENEPHEPIDTYTVLRRIDDPAARRAVAGAGRGLESAAVAGAGAFPIVEWKGRRLVTGAATGGRGELPPGVWEVLGSFGAFQQETYFYEATTVADSTESGIPYAVFCVLAQTTTPWVWYASLPDSGYSVDNIAPEVPSGFALEYHAPGGNLLVWDPCPDEDFQHFRIYRDESESFEPDPANLVHMTIETTWLDGEGTGWHYYRITAVDHGGNESGPAAPGEVTGVEEPPVPARLALYQNMPNPVGPATSIRYDVPAGGGRVRLEVFDVAGRMIRSLVDGAETPGRREVTWDGTDESGRRVASGTYFYRLELGGESVTKKLLLVR